MMKKLKNWDNKTWLSSKNYILKFNKFLNKKVKFDKNTKILDIGCGRANIISALNNKYKFNIKPIGLDIVKNKGVKTNIIFKKTDAHNFLKRDKENLTLYYLNRLFIFFSSSKMDKLLNIAKKRLGKRGKILIFSLKTKNNKIPCFKMMRQKLDNSLKRDESLLKVIQKKFEKNPSYFF